MCNLAFSGKVQSQGDATLRAKGGECLVADLTEIGGMAAPLRRSRFLSFWAILCPGLPIPPASRPLRPPFGRQKPLLPPLRSAQGGRPEAGIRVRGTTRIALGRRWLIGFGRARGYAEPWCGRGTLARRDERPSETIPRPIVGPAVPGTALLSLCAESGSPQGRGLQARRCAASFISCCFWRSCRRA